ncbi:NAD(P)-dependent alcohol dehydrogenase [Chitinophaga sp. XS-30]|uniref:zinc-dependent alcohol dehydrogenase family protein n=1 Tax=Chitinophaga sp. XS-30 TaxID=2604421 RepID=UPI0011DE527A|nr:NAD(P)-dependent alcohol dehydrogenase [Chitinophaga sp. XS-30]QEH41971.1 NAD(P)-dependent alcohol dehydrogenase [Chitinophaga sp. XS-30]
MKSIQINSFGLAQLSMQDIPVPQPGNDEVLVKVTAASLNYIDLDVIRGNYDPHLPLPHIPVSDAAGIVEAVGNNVSQWKKGDRVTTHYLREWISGRRTEAMFHKRQGLEFPGVLAEYIVLPAAGIMRAPVNLSDEEAATLPIAGLTAWAGLVEAGEAKPGQTVLIQGTGGVSIFAMQIANYLGMKTIALTGAESKAQKLKALGADEVINYKTHPEWPKEVLRLTNGRGVDASLNIAGGGTVSQSVQALAIGGFIGLVGYLDNPAIPLDFFSMLQRNARIAGITVGSLESYAHFVTFIEKTGLKPVIDSVFPFHKAADALQYLESGQHFGKVVISFRDIQS